MQIEKVGDSIRELLEKNEFLKMLMSVSDYIIYGYTALVVLTQFLSLGDFVSALLVVLFYPLLILAFAGKKYIGLVVLFAGQAFACLYKIIIYVYYSMINFFVRNLGNIWQNVFGLIIFGLLLWLAIALFLKNQPAKPVHTAPLQQGGQPYFQQMPYQQPQQQAYPNPMPQQPPVPQAPTVPPTASQQIPTAPASPQPPFQPAPQQAPAVAPAEAVPAPSGQEAPVAPAADHTPYQRPEAAVPAAEKETLPPENASPVAAQQAQSPSAAVTPPGVVCPQCGAILPEENAYCTRCGHKLRG